MSNFLGGDKSILNVGGDKSILVDEVLDGGDKSILANGSLTFASPGAVEIEEIGFYWQPTAGSKGWNKVECDTDDNENFSATIPVPAYGEYDVKAYMRFLNEQNLPDLLESAVSSVNVQPS